jgi:cysteinyl-tRNA synthetase
LNTPEALIAFPEGADLLGLMEQNADAWFSAGADSSAVETSLARYREARSARDWAAADSIRDALKAEGIEISVAKDGTTSWRKA